MRVRAVTSIGFGGKRYTTLIEGRKTRFRHLQDRLGDPLLTVLTILLALMLFVIAPLHAAGVLLGLALSWVVARAVFAPGRITYHRIMGAILLYLTIGVTFVALYTFLGLLIPDAFSGMSLKDTPALSGTLIYFSFGTLTTAGAGYTRSREASLTSRQ